MANRRKTTPANKSVFIRKSRQQTINEKSQSSRWQIKATEEKKPNCKFSNFVDGFQYLLTLSYFKVFVLFLIKFMEYRDEQVELLCGDRIQMRPKGAVRSASMQIDWIRDGVNGWFW